MDERALLALSVTVSLLGMFVLYTVVSNYEIDNMNLLESFEKEHIVISGDVVSVTHGEKITFLSVRFEDTVDVIAFDDKPIGLSEGDEIEVRGEIDDSKGTRQVIASRIKKKEI